MCWCGLRRRVCCEGWAVILLSFHHCSIRHHGPQPDKWPQSQHWHTVTNHWDEFTDLAFITGLLNCITMHKCLVMQLFSLLLQNNLPLFILLWLHVGTLHNDWVVYIDIQQHSIFHIRVGDIPVSSKSLLSHSAITWILQTVSTMINVLA